jgi:hypothetical protein
LSVGPTAAFVDCVLLLLQLMKKVVARTADSVKIGAHNLIITMSDVRFHNLTGVPLQEEFTPSTVIKISTASKCFAAVIGIISICVFTLTDNAKTSITTIQTTDSVGNCMILSSFTGNTDENSGRVTATQASDFFEGYKQLLKDVTGAADVSIFIDSQLNDLWVSRKAHGGAYQQVYFENYQNCIDGFSKPVLCNYVQLGTGQEFDQPLPISDRRGRGFCQSYLNCAWPGVSWLSFRKIEIVMNATAFSCVPSANFATCDKISSKCPEYTRFAADFGKLYQRLQSPQYLCAPFKQNPPYSCRSFQVVSPIQVVSQTLSLMATALGGSELFLYLLLKYRRMWPSSSNVKVQPASSTLP